MERDREAQRFARTCTGPWLEAVVAAAGLKAKFDTLIWLERRNNLSFFMRKREPMVPFGYCRRACYVGYAAWLGQRTRQMDVARKKKRLELW